MIGHVQLRKRESSPILLQGPSLFPLNNNHNIVELSSILSCLNFAGKPRTRRLCLTSAKNVR